MTRTVSAPTIQASEDGHGESLLVCLTVDPTVAEQLKIKGGERPGDLHVTLAYVEGASVMSDLTRAEALVAAKNVCQWAAPLQGRISGYGRFLADDPADKDVFYASVDMPGLDRLAADLRAALSMAGMPPSEKHGFDPHITLAYLDPGTPNPVKTLPTLDLRFDAVAYCLGALNDGGQLTELPLRDGWGSFSETLAASELATVCDATEGRFRLVLGDPESARFTLSASGDFPEWVPVLPKPGVYAHPVWGDIAITPERNAEFVSNFNDAVYQSVVPVDAEHQTKLGGAFGYLTELRQNSDGSVDGRVELTDRGRTIMARDGFRYVSPEWYETWEQPESGKLYHNVLIGLAFTNNPFFKERNGALRPILAASDGALYWPERTHEAGDAPSFTFNALAPRGPEATTMTEQEKQATGAAASATATGDTITLTASEVGEYRAMSGKLAEMERRMSELDATAKALADQNAELKAERRATRFAEMAKEWPGDTADHVATLADLAQSFGEDSDQVKRYARTQDAAAKQIADSKLFAEVGNDAPRKPREGSAVADVDLAVAKLMSENAGMTLAAATNRVFQENPSLYRRYTAETALRVG